MTKAYITPAMKELRAALAEAEALSTHELSKREEVRLNVLLAKIATLRGSTEATTADEHGKRWFRDFFAGRTPEERTNPDMQAGTETIAYTQGLEGGYLVPTEFYDDVTTGMAQFDPLLSKDVVTLIESGDMSLRPFQIPGWDLSTFTAVKVAEGSQQSSQVPPTVAGIELNGYKYMASLPASFELEEDAFEPLRNRMAAAFSIGMARGIGVDLSVGNGTSAPQGVLTGASNSGFTTAVAGSISSDDIESIFFAVNRFYRQSPKCAWVFNDATYQKIRKAKDTANQPLISIVDGREVLMGKPVLVSPSLLSTGSGIVFGDLSYFMVRVSRMSLKRSTQVPGYVEKGKALYTGVMRADSKVFDPTGGSVPPIVFAGIHS